MMNRKKIRLTLVTVLMTLITTVLISQNDVVLKTNGEEMIGQVTAINDQNIAFIHQNETLEYSVNKSDISKITFGSGRIEYFHNKDKASSHNLEDHHNKVAILPFAYIKDQERSNPTMTKKIQQETYSIFKNKANILKFQDPTTTNALLAKADITDNVEGYTMGEICNVLGVEYVIQGLVSIEESNMTSFSSSQSNTKRGNNAYVDRNGRIIGNIGNNNSRRSSTNISTTTQNYSTNITMNVYTDKGKNVYSKDHESFWQTQDAYKITLQYLAKRTPIFKK